MKKIEIYIREIQLKEDFTPIKHKRFIRVMVAEDENFDKVLPVIIDDLWIDIRDYFLRNRYAIPFTEIRRDYE